MRLTLSTTDYKNTDISDERGYTYYTISTPSPSKKVTTITKYNWNASGSDGHPETMAVIEWHRTGETVFRFGGKVTPAKVMLETRSWSGGRCFVGPDQRTYKWKLGGHCWMKRAGGSDVELVRFHKQNLGMRKPLHPAYLDVSTEVVPILDHIILTFVYVESLRQARQARHAHAAHVPPSVLSGPSC